MLEEKEWLERRIKKLTENVKWPLKTHILENMRPH